MTKKSPGIQCSKCSKWIHGDCASISTDQLAALVNTDSVDWKCRTCTGNAKPKRLSCILPDQDDEEYTDNESLSNAAQHNKITQKILQDIRREVREIISSELKTTLQFYSDKIDEYEEKINLFEHNMKFMENQCKDAKNAYQNLQLKHDTLEQKLNDLEQQRVSNIIEICGIQEQTDEDVKEITKKLCTVIQQNQDTIMYPYRKTQKEQKPRQTATTKNVDKPLPIIVVTLQDGARNQWLEATKKLKLTGKDLGYEDDSTRIYLREALTPNASFLLWKTKTELKDTELCKYVWFKNGQVLVRKTENDKHHVIRAINDIDRLKALFASDSRT